METWDAICARRNVRQYKPEPVSDDDLNHIAEAEWWELVEGRDRTRYWPLSHIEQ
jgi:hypothetical protein